MKLSFSLAILLVCIAQAFAFMPNTPIRSRQVVKMSATNKQTTDIVKTGKNMMAALTPLILSSPVFATEGTGEALGVDDSRILPIIASIGAAFAFLFSTWSNKQDNDEFFNGYQKTDRKVCCVMCVCVYLCISACRTCFLAPSTPYSFSFFSPLYTHTQ